VREALETSLKELGLEYLDLWLMHWPQAHIGGWYPFDAGGMHQVNASTAID